MNDDIEMDDEQEQEQEPIEEPDYDDADEDDQDDDDMDDDDANGDDEDDADNDDDDEEDGDDDDGASVSASRNDNSRRSVTVDESLSSATYFRKVQERRKLFRPPPSYTSTSLGYHIEPMAAAPHSAQIHAMSLSLDGQTLLTGGSDGYVRKYDVHATMNGKTMLTQNVRHGFVEGITRGGSLTAFWGNEEWLPTSAPPDQPPHGPEKDRLLGVVHSLAIQQDSLWGLSGSESGNIHLYGLRHEPGITRHVFRKHKGAVSALTLTPDEVTMISGGWDRGVHQWDLNTGQVVRSFEGFAGQISSLAFRPYSAQEERRADGELNISIHPSAVANGAKEEEKGAEVSEDAEDRAPNENGDATMADEDAGADAKSDNGDAKKGEEDASHPSKEAISTSRTGVPKSDPGKATADAKADELNQDQLASGPISSNKAQTDAKADTSTNATAEDAAAASEPNGKPASTIDSKDADPTTPAAKEASPPSATTKNEPTEAVAPSTGAGGDDPTEEELAFEAELNASLGMSLDGTAGATKADGTRPDTFALSASGATAGGLMVAGADEGGDDDDLFDSDIPPASSTAGKDTKEKETKPQSNGNSGGGNESDGDDSLFGDGDEDADGYADADAEIDAEADADADGDADGDAEGEDDDEDGSSDEDMPLAGRSMAKNSSSQSNMLASTTASPSLSIALPSSTPANAAKDTKATTPGTPPPPPAAAAAAAAAAKQEKALPKPAFGGFSIASCYSAPLSTFSRDVMLSTSLSGQVILWDLRCPNYTRSSPNTPAKGVHSLPLPAKIPPWCQSAVLDSTGNKVFVGRRNESVDEWDLRFTPTSTASTGSTSRFVRSLRLPSGSGPVYSLAAMPNGRHIVCGSYDNIRLWDTEFLPGPGVGGEAKVPFKIVAGHHGASLSSVLVDSSSRFLISASGDRGWMGSSTEAVIIHDIKALT
ncbi:hypothetical protein NDA11_000208 [Ustilago hordei]|uniref:Related to Transcription factor SPT8 n=1 Tax=Ustilago hordei TaxID=120017 RepID=I2FUV2_USTHO|nr:uncharacterized protein UHO2_07286 [Ustilago hordei]KAJ1040770.1 hypothetical protein NDA10_007570 [Ustilago hordei]KAJ1576450.1 hypothetical protein NDA12_005054 [Ustilago hordei]KAJ1577794.1 hypothetical protein NDA15_003269 [Ustilago hordei]KAJ1596430.1 hypothetical protein NDA11_000208 [Ustilago hordei]KAJ1598850.1 hypothetical protein NDA14_003492 [Ustilago hordei]